MAAPESETAGLLASGDDAKPVWRVKHTPWRTIGAGVTVRTLPTFFMLPNPV
jgi:hypothetical protein